MNEDSKQPSDQHRDPIHLDRANHRRWSHDGIAGGSSRWVANTDEWLCDTTQHSLYITMSGGSRRTEAWTENGRRYRGRDVPGDVSFIPATLQRQAMYSGVRMEYAAVRFAPTVVDRLLPEISNLNGIELIPFTNRQDQLLYNLLLTLREEAENGLADALFTESLLTTAALHLLRHSSNRTTLALRNGGSVSDNRIAGAVQYLRDNLSRNITLTELASIAGMSPSHLVHAFKRAAGYTPHQYLIRHRIEEAKALLADRRRSIADIAYAVGFSSQSHLTAHFRRLLHVTPKSYRNGV